MSSNYQPTYAFLSTVIAYGTDQQSKKLKFQHQWLHNFLWLAYSAKLEDASCTFCVEFTYILKY